MYLSYCTKNKRFVAFTLAEVLMVLLVIGTVASIVVPPIINETQDAELKTAWKKEFGILANATKLIVNDNGGSLVNVFSFNNNSGKHIVYFYKPYLNYLKFCTSSQLPGNCWHKADGSVKNIQGTPITNFVWYNFALILSDGTLIGFSGEYKDNCSTDRGLGAGNESCGFIIVDVNGFKKPNIYGRDIFLAVVTKNRLIPVTKNSSFIDGKCNTGGLGCSAQALYQ